MHLYHHECTFNVTGAAMCITVLHYDNAVSLSSPGVRQLSISPLNQEKKNSSSCDAINIPRYPAAVETLLNSVICNCSEAGNSWFLHFSKWTHHCHLEVKVKSNSEIWRTLISGRVFAKHAAKPWTQRLALHKLAWCPTNPSICKESWEDEKFKIILSYIGNSRPAKE